MDQHGKLFQEAQCSCVSNVTNLKEIWIKKIIGCKAPNGKHFCICGNIIPVFDTSISVWKWVDTFEVCRSFLHVRERFRKVHEEQAEPQVEVNSQDVRKDIEIKQNKIEKKERKQRVSEFKKTNEFNKKHVACETWSSTKNREFYITCFGYKCRHVACNEGVVPKWGVYCPCCCFAYNAGDESFFLGKPLSQKNMFKLITP